MEGVIRIQEILRRAADIFFKQTVNHCQTQRNMKIGCDVTAAPGHLEG
jgi:hypothetical protein